MFHNSHCNHTYHHNANYIYPDLCNSLYMETMARRIFDNRIKLGLAQQGLADRIGVSRVSVTKWENGDTENIKLDNLNALMREFDMTFSELVEGKKEAARPAPSGDDQSASEENAREETTEEVSAKRKYFA